MIDLNIALPVVATASVAGCKAFSPFAWEHYRKTKTERQLNETVHPANDRSSPGLRVCAACSGLFDLSPCAAAAHRPWPSGRSVQPLPSSSSCGHFSFRPLAFGARRRWNARCPRARKASSTAKRISFLDDVAAEHVGQEDSATSKVMAISVKPVNRTDGSGFFSTIGWPRTMASRIS